MQCRKSTLYTCYFHDLQNSMRLFFSHQFMMYALTTGNSISSPEERGRWRTPAWTSCRSPQTDAPSAGRWSRSRCHHRRSGRWGSPADPCTGQPACGCGPKPGPRFPCRWCSDRGRSCWRRPLCQWQAAPGGRVVGIFQFSPHLNTTNTVLDLNTQNNITGTF